MTQSSRVNYDDVASNYDLRMTKTYLVGVTAALQNLARQVEARRVLDLGCGTGRSLQGLGDNLQPSPVCYGLDLSAGMLTQAHCLDAGYRLTQASAPRPPFIEAGFDLAFCAHAFHHFPDKFQVVQSAYALLRPGGAFAIVNIDPHEGRHNWFAYEYFQGTYETDLKGILFKR